MKRYIKSDTSRGLNEDEIEYLVSKLFDVTYNMLSDDYEIDDIQYGKNSIRFAIYDTHGGGAVTDPYTWIYDPDGDEGPEEQLDEWIDDFEYALPSKYKNKKKR